MINYQWVSTSVVSENYLRNLKCTDTWLEVWLSGKTHLRMHKALSPIPSTQTKNRKKQLTTTTKKKPNTWLTPGN
jgi:hypothetical protein